MSCSTRKSKTDVTRNPQKKWWVVEGVYVFKNRRARKREVIMCARDGTTMVPDMFPSKESAEREIWSQYQDEEYWKYMKAVEVTLAHTGN